MTRLGLQGAGLAFTELTKKKKIRTSEKKEKVKAHKFSTCNERRIKFVTACAVYEL